MATRNPPKKRNHKKKQKPLTFLVEKPAGIVGGTRSKEEFGQNQDLFPELKTHGITQSSQVNSNASSSPSSTSTSDRNQNQDHTNITTAGALPTTLIFKNPGLLERTLMMQALNPKNVEMLKYFKEYKDDYGKFYENLEEIHKNVFYIRKNTVQDPLDKIHKKLLDIYISSYDLAEKSLRIGEYFSQHNFNIDSNIANYISHLAEFSRQKSHQIKDIVNEIEDLSLIVQTKKRYNNNRHGFYPSIYLSKGRKEINGFKTENSPSDESVGSDDEDNEDQRNKEQCSKCGEKTYGDIRYIRVSCFYNMSEIGINELKFNREDNNYVLPVCKDCRHDFMFNFFPKWFYQKRNPDIQQNAAVKPEQMEKFLNDFSKF
jgi:hypothetical protein